MSDLLASLLAAKSNSSQESFQSSYSQPSPSSGAATASSASDLNPPASSKTQASAFQDAGLSVYDVDSYLAEAKNLASSTQASNEGSHSQYKSTQVASNQLEPISLGSKTRHHVAALNILCQAKGLTAVFEIEGVTDFGGVLKLGKTAVKSEERWKSKKDAKEGLAEKGLDIVKAIDAKGKQSERSGEAGKNWVGMLLGECISLKQPHRFYLQSILLVNSKGVEQKYTKAGSNLIAEYHNYIDPSRGPIYEEYVLGLFFACECTIPSRPNQLFGSKTEMFSNKKAARVNAAKQAVEYLISEGELNPDGSTKARKKIAAGAAVRMEGKGLKVSKDLSYAQKVNGKLEIPILL